MHIWVVIIGLLALSIIFLFISLFLKDNDYEEEMDEMSETLLELNREIYYLKKKIQELEGTPKVMNVPKQPLPKEEYEPVEEVYETRVETPAYTTQSFEPVYEEPVVDSKKLHNITKQHIITLYSQGCELEEIAEQLTVPLTTVQLVIDNYFEMDAE